ncbi:MAG: hypothetical protein CJD30_03605 [Sulfuricurvum sp. PD_MW2]|uniref:NrdR family transcriptional regulator n=1 Tax=Sulfuricurvum sp. PD_MW2 TaxID=2027917 RepID=UPI000C063416|nr:hypothetical protein [Sulfuricurvum sp. PD_MW2]PHM18059.1 MAG: hypothetical protein CJD30_03605 [Sulfuricurvum sp. PD_MW2]
MICPYCANERTRVIGTVKGTENERFRKCNKCKKTFQTIEAIKFDDYWKDYAKAVHEDSKQED